MHIRKNHRVAYYQTTSLYYIPPLISTASYTLTFTHIHQVYRLYILLPSSDVDGRN